MATETRGDVRTATQMDRPQMRQERQEARGGQAQMGRQSPDNVPVGGETKHALKTTEFWIFIAAVGGVMLASLLVGVTDTHSDYFRADKAWWFTTLLTIGYLASRGLSKVGSATKNPAGESKK